MVQFREQFVFNAKGRPTAVVLDIREYRKLLQRLEDAEDVKYLKFHRRERTIPFRQVVTQLKAKGLLV